jgi:dTDP-4-amino-4,6-dideoxygalactose transaminase
MSIPMVDLKQQYQNLKAEIEPAVCQALDDAHYILGPNVTAFEQEAAAYLGVKHAVGVASGTDALELALLACGIGPGDEVITPSFTFIATVEAILYCGATPVFIDIDRSNFNIDIAQIESLITDKTKAIMPVHLYGNPVNMPAIMKIANHHQLKVIEDCAQSFGATWQEQQTGTFGDAGCFSFYPSKNLSGFGDGGLITTSSDAIYHDLIALRNHGSYTRYHHEKLGYNSRLDEIQAAILRVKLKHIDEFNQQRYQAAQHYARALQNIVTTPKLDDNNQHIFHQYTILHPKRDAIQTALKANDIASAIYYPIPIHKQPLFAGKYDDLDLPVTEALTEECLSLPMFPELTETQTEQICQTIKRAVNA